MYPVCVSSVDSPEFWNCKVETKLRLVPMLPRIVGDPVRATFAEPPDQVAVTASEAPPPVAVTNPVAYGRIATTVEPAGRVGVANGNDALPAVGGPIGYPLTPPVPRMVAAIEDAKKVTAPMW